MLHKVHFVEKWGKGIRLILSKEPTADFEEIGRHFIAIFKRKNAERDVEDEAENAPVNAPVKLNKTQLQILNAIQQNNLITYDELSLKLNKDRTTIRKNISKLKQLGIIQRTGSDKNGYWEVRKNPEIPQK